MNYSAAHPRFPLVLSGKSYLVPFPKCSSLEPSSLHACFVQAVFWTQSRTESGRVGAKYSRSFFWLQGHVWHMDNQGITCGVSIRVNKSLSTCFEVGWLQVSWDLAHSVRDKLGFTCTGQMQRQNL